MTDEPQLPDDDVVLDPIDRVQMYDTSELSMDDLRRIEDVVGLVSGLDLAARIETEHERLRRAERSDPLVMFTHGEVVRIGVALLSGMMEITATDEIDGDQGRYDIEAARSVARRLLGIEVEESEIPEHLHVTDDIETLRTQFEDESPDLDDQIELAQLVDDLQNM